MLRMRNIRTLVVAALVGCAYLGAPSTAQAAFAVYLQEAGVNGGAVTQVASGSDFGALSYSGTYGDFTVTLVGASSDNAYAGSDLLSSSNKVVNNVTTAKTLQIIVTQTNYTLPSGSPLTLESGLGGSKGSATTVVGLSGIFQAYADKNNNPLGMSDFTNGPQTASLTGSTFDTGSASGQFNRTNPKFSVTSVTKLALSGKGLVGYSNHVTLVNPNAVPAPAGVVLALSGLPFLGIGRWLRRRNAVAESC